MSAATTQRTRYFDLPPVRADARSAFADVASCRRWLDELTDVPPAANTPVRLHVHGEPTATREYLQSRLGADDLVIWDARAPQEFSGEKVLAAKGGHIPGAINFEWTAGMDLNDHLRIRQDIAEVLQQLGITPDKEVITHCQSHRRSGFTYLVAKALGYPRIKAYAGSWSEWGNHPDTPVEV